MLHIKVNGDQLYIIFIHDVQCSAVDSHPPSAHSAICVLVNGPCTSASSVFSHLYSHDTSLSLEAELAPPTDDDEEVEGSSMSANMSTGSME